MQNKLPTLLTSLAIGITLAGAALMLIGSEVSAKPAALLNEQVASPVEAVNPKIKAIYDKLNLGDNKNSEASQPLLDETRQCMLDGEIRSGSDYACASMIMVKGKSLEDNLLAHDLAVCAMALGSIEAKPVVAMSQDRILTLLGEKQRFGTHTKSGKLLPTDTSVPDSLRFILGIPALREVKDRVAKGEPTILPKMLPPKRMMFATERVALTIPATE